jgi:hypothetical protein
MEKKVNKIDFVIRYRTINDRYHIKVKNTPTNMIANADFLL